MSDAQILPPVEIKIRVENLEEKTVEQKSRIDEHEGLLDIHSKEIDGLKIWRNGNGAKGAEERLQCVEENQRAAGSAIITDDVVDRIGKAAASHIIKSARDKDRTFAMKARALAPWFVAALEFILGVIALIWAVNGGAR